MATGSGYSSAPVQSEHPVAVPRHPRVAAKSSTHLCANGHAKPDTRRFAGIFPLKAPESVATDRTDVTDREERDEDSDTPSRWEFVAAPDGNISSSQVASSSTSMDEGSTLSAAQQVVASYRAVHSSDLTPGCATAEINEKDLPRIPDDQRSMYTLATSTDVQSPMDLMWRPKPKVHMHRTDQRALVQAQSQAIAMMHNAGLKPTNKIQCRRRGCADILPDVEALKYHLHIHNIADNAAGCKAAPLSIACKPFLAECSISKSMALKRSHSRSKSSHGTWQNHLTTGSPPRKHSASSLLPSLFSPREITPEAQYVPSLATVAKAFVSDSSPSKSSGPICNNNAAPSTLISTSSRGRRIRKESIAVSVGTECNPSITLLLSPPSSPNTHGSLAPTPRMNLPIPFTFNPAMGDENGSQVCARGENVRLASEKLKGSRSPTRALSPARAMSPIRNGIRRVLSIGRATDLADE